MPGRSAALEDLPRCFPLRISSFPHDVRANHISMAGRACRGLASGQRTGPACDHQHLRAARAPELARPDRRVTRNGGGLPTAAADELAVLLPTTTGFFPSGVAIVDHLRSRQHEWPVSRSW